MFYIQCIFIVICKARYYHSNFEYSFDYSNILIVIHIFFLFYATGIGMYTHIYEENKHIHIDICAREKTWFIDVGMVQIFFLHNIDNIYRLYMRGRNYQREREKSLWEYQQLDFIAEKEGGIYNVMLNMFDHTRSSPRFIMWYDWLLFSSTMLLYKSFERWKTFDLLILMRSVSLTLERE